MHKKWNRIGASVIDNSIIVLIATVVRWILMLFFGELLLIRGGGEPIDLLLDFLRVFFLLLVSVFISVQYCMLSYKRYGSTIGQIILKVHIISADSTGKKIIKPSNKSILKREQYKWFLIIGTFYLYGIYCIVQIIREKKVLHNHVSNIEVEVW